MLSCFENHEDCPCKHIKIFSSDFVFQKTGNHTDNQNCQSESRPLCNKILLLISFLFNAICIDQETQGAFKGRWKVKKLEVPGFVSYDSFCCFVSSRTKPI